MGEGREGEKNEEMSGEENWGEGERNGEERKVERLIQFLFSVIIPYSKNYFFPPQGLGGHFEVAQSEFSMILLAQQKKFLIFFKKIR